MTRTVSQSNTTNEMNAKGYPTVGMLCPKSPHKKETNPYISECVSLEKTVEKFVMVVEITEYSCRFKHINNSKFNRWSREIFRKLFDFIDRSMKPTFDEIDAMLLVCKILLATEMKTEMAEFILNCPDKFLITYTNNSERSPAVFRKLQHLGLNNICNYLIPYIHYTKLGTWNERSNTHIRGNIDFKNSF